ncbi:hypothetical protein SDC9_12054 [bioreactor metagenome]|uniref:NAD-specific glutamate dehydrogenase n=1 Tax=bioreactor metagenome TaxID=1076179 RepID=A0A644TKX7_9ZZZZ
MAELDALGLAAMFAADADLEIRPGRAAALDAQLHQFSDADLIDGHEGVLGEDGLSAFLLGLDVIGKEAPGVVPGKSKGHLGEIVGAEGEELRGLGDLIGEERRPGNFDHGAHEVFHLGLGLGDDGIGHGPDLIGEDLEFLLVDGQGDHDFGQNLDFFLVALHRGFDDRRHLHIENFGIGNGQAAASVTQHGVGFVELVAAHPDELRALAGYLGELVDTDVVLGGELVQGGIDEPDGDGLAVHGFEDADEIFPLEGQELGQCLFPGLQIVGDDHFLDGQLAFLGVGGVLEVLEEHMLGPAETNAFGAQLYGLGRVLGRVGVGAHLQAAYLVAPGKEGFEFLGLFGLGQGQGGGENLAGRAVDGDLVSLLENLAAHPHEFGFVVYIQGLAADYAAFAPAPGHDGGVGSLSAGGGENALGGEHAADILGGGFAADENDLFALGGHGFGILGVEHQFAGGRAGNGIDAGGELQFLELGGAYGGRVDDGVEDTFDLFGRYALNSLFLGDEAFLDHIHRDLECGGGQALAGAALKHVELLVLDGEFQILHFLEVLLQYRPYLEKLLIGLGKLGRQFHKTHGGADAGHHILTLGVDQAIAVEFVLARVGIPGEADAGTGVVALVAEDHLNHVDRRTLEVGDFLDTPVGHRFLGFPGVEDRVYRSPELLHGILGEFLSLLGFIESLELGAEFLEIPGLEFGVVLDPELLLHLREHFLHGFLGESHGGGGIHLDEAPVGIVSETGIVGFVGQPLDGDIVQAQVEDCFEHSGHRARGAGANRNEKGILGVAQLFAGHFLQLDDSGFHLVDDVFRKLAFCPVVFLAGGYADRETGGDGETDPGHLHKPLAFSA